MSEGAANFVTAMTALAAFSATGAAWWGVWSWKEQRKWEDSRAIGKRALLDLQSFRAQLGNLRSPAIIASEYVKQMEDVDHPIADHHFWRRYYAMDDRIRKLVDIEKDLRATFDECCVLWGDEVENWLDEILESKNEITGYIRLDLLRRHPEAKAEVRKAANDLLEGRRDCSTEIVSDRKADEFWDEFLMKFNRVRFLVRAKMR